MSTSINGSNGVTFPDSSTQASAQVGMKNRIIDGGFTINQRGYVSNTSLSSGAYAHDRWKAGSSGCTYTFTQGSLGVNTTITITAGTLVQVIEGCNLGEGGTYVLSWTGTAQARLNGGSYGNSGITITGWTAGTNLSVEFSTGTVGSVQLEKGSTATSFDYRPYGTELALCQRYYEKSYNTDVSIASSTNDGAQIFNGSADGSGVCYISYTFKVSKRSNPTITAYTTGGGSGSWSYSRSGASGNGAANVGFQGNNSFFVAISTGGAWVPVQVNGHWTASAEL